MSRVFLGLVVFLSLAFLERGWGASMAWREQSQFTRYMVGVLQELPRNQDKIVKVMSGLSSKDQRALRAILKDWRFEKNLFKVSERFNQIAIYHEDRLLLTLQVALDSKTAVVLNGLNWPL